MSRAINDYMFLYEHLMDKDIENQTFEYISSILLKHFSKNDYLSVGTLLIFLMKQGDLPGVIQKMCSYYIIYDMFKSDGQNDSPFSQFLLSSIDTKEPITTKITMIERNFLNKLLVGGTKEIAKQTPRNLLQLDCYPTTVDMSSLRALCLEQQNELPMTVRSSLINVIAAPTGNITDSSAADLMEGLCSNDTPLKNVLSPQFLTIAPPLLSCDDELIWFDLTNPAWHKPAYDSSICSSNNIGLEAKRLITQAFKQALCIMDQQTLLTELEKDPNMVYHIGLTPTKLPKLVEKNPLVAIEILLKLMNSTQITEYFSVLVNMEMSLHSMEVVNRLTTSVDLPTEFVHLYISNCISTCETIKDKYMQSRLVRLVCVFLQSLIRNKIINVKELFIEVEAFCVEFSKIREAAGLYRLLKQLEIGETNVNNFNKVKE